jgi:hypothetical protein
LLPNCSGRIANPFDCAHQLIFGHAKMPRPGWPAFEHPFGFDLLEFDRRGWTNTAAGYFDPGTKYLQLADKSSRTVALLTERLDQQRGRGQQQITVKHVTVNAGHQGGGSKAK